jgi:hypothetical protein
MDESGQLHVPAALFLAEKKLLESVKRLNAS